MTSSWLPLARLFFMRFSRGELRAPDFAKQDPGHLGVRPEPTPVFEGWRLPRTKGEPSKFSTRGFLLRESGAVPSGCHSKEVSLNDFIASFRASRLQTKCESGVRGAGGRDRWRSDVCPRRAASTPERREMQFRVRGSRLVSFHSFDSQKQIEGLKSHIQIHTMKPMSQTIVNPTFLSGSVCMQEFKAQGSGAFQTRIFRYRNRAF